MFPYSILLAEGFKAHQMLVKQENSINFIKPKILKDSAKCSG